jgi:LysR family transcriptional regulator, glycine cleavage system transcriptional activator
MLQFKKISLAGNALGYSIPPLNSVRAFEAAARHMSFQRAAEELSITPSALSYQIQRLEEFLQVKLFVRLNRSVELTPAGQTISRKISDGFAILDDAFALIRPKAESNVLSISCGPAFSLKWLVPNLRRFAEANPDIETRILGNSSAPVDFLAQGADAGILFGTHADPGLYVERIFDEIALPLIAPTLFEELGGEANAAIFENVRLLHDISELQGGAMQWRDWLHAAGIDSVDPWKGSRFSNTDLVIESAIDGGGIAFARLTLALRDMLSGRLIAPFDLCLRTSGGFFFCCPVASLESSKVSRFLNWIRDEVEAHKVLADQVLAGKQIK